MKPHIKYLAEHSAFIVSYIPNTALSESLGGQADYYHSPVSKMGYALALTRLTIAMSTIGYAYAAMKPIHNVLIPILLMETRFH
jgi:methionine synthase I (cobalamin-dependent)